VTSFSGAAARASAVATTLLTLDTGLWALHLAIRPPCPPNYGRLLDFAPAVPVLSGIFTLFAGGLWLVNRSDDSPWLGFEGWLAAALGVVGVALLICGLGVLGTDGQSVDPNCWTF
jgi:hypothetical protein